MPEVRQDFLVLEEDVEERRITFSLGDKAFSFDHSFLLPHNRSMRLVALTKDLEETFIEINQEAFQLGFEAYFGKTNQTIIPRRDILASLNAKGSHAFLAYEGDTLLGGVCVVINEETNINDLHLLFVKPGVQSGGIGFAIWNEIEKMYPNTKIWKTCTPYFDQRNIHFYVNKCKFHVVKFLNRNCPGNFEEDFIGDGNEGMFEFEKVMK